MNDSLSSPSNTTVLSPQGQITIPANIRKALSLKPGINLTFTIKTLAKNYRAIVAYILPKDPIDHYYGIGRDFYQKSGGSDRALKKERASWEK